MINKIDIYKSGGILIKNKKVLIARSRGKSIFFAPGGKIEKNETPEDALIRELVEEFKIETKKENFEKFGTFIHPVAGDETKIIQMEVFIVKSWKNEPKPNREIEEILWINSREAQSLNIGSIFQEEVIPRLKQKNLID